VTNEYETLARELSAMAAEDRRVRAELARDGSLFEGYHPRMQAVHDRNAARLREILDAHGWPTRSLVGERAAGDAWMILQHAIGHPWLMRRGLELLRRASAGEVPPIEIAMLDDRIRTFEGRGQLYGTQFDWDEEGRMSPLPVEDAEGVDARRAEIGLPPLAEAVAKQRTAMERNPESRPRDLAKRKREMESWLERVGWR
jgi:hypothetical protein